jgi:Amino acid synthesis
MDELSSGATTGSPRQGDAGMPEGFPAQVRKVQIIRETVLTDGDAAVRVIGAAVVSNEWCGHTEADFFALAELGERLATVMMPDLLAFLGAPVIAYGKAAIVGLSGQLEHGAALIHPKLGSPIRSAIGGGAAVIPSNNKLGAAGSSIDIPVGHKDDAWSFAFIDTLTLSVSDAPRSEEIVLFLALASGGRPFARIGAPATAQEDAAFSIGSWPNSYEEATRAASRASPPELRPTSIAGNPGNAER